MDFDSYSLRVFCQVMQDKTFSEAARSLRVTQPTVSQQIAKLESVTGKLFQRVGHNLIPSPIAHEFHSMAIQVLDRVEEFKHGLHQQQNLPQGLVRYAMPESCQWTPHYKSIMAQLSHLPNIRFQISILPSHEIIQSILEAKIDFGFIVGERLSPELRFQKFSDEAYSAIASDRALFECLTKSEKIGNLRLVTYPGWELFFSTWATHHGLGEKFISRLQAPVLHIGTLAGAIHAIQQGTGVGIIPTHCVEKELSKGDLFEWSPKKKDRALNPIYLARRIGEKMPKRVETTIELLTKAKMKERV
jgi:DNA-binding transcriptional LysR family regulator